MRALPLPKELVFRVDDTIVQAIADAVAVHKKGVCFLNKFFHVTVSEVASVTPI